MLKKIPIHKRKRFLILSFVIAPILFLLSFIIGTKVVELFGIKIDLTGMLFVGFIILLIYIRYVLHIYKLMTKN
jgi:small neutral amino acid transporter SnatA (MarC family)